MLDVPREAVRGLIAAGTVFFQALHHNPVEIAPHLPGQPHRLQLSLCRNRSQRVLRVTEPSTGFGGSSSRISRSTSVTAACSSRFLVSGVVPVRSSYRSTPRL